MILKYIVENKNYLTINDVLSNEFNFSTRQRLKLIKMNRIYLNNIITDTRLPVSINDIVTIDLGYEEDNSNILPTNMKVDIIFEDDWLLIVNKPHGIAIHPSIRHLETSLSNGIKYYFDSINLKKKIRPVNRLDIDTSGIVIFAKCEYIQESLSKQMTTNIFKKEYLCIVEGHLKNTNGIINLPIGRRNGSIIERCIDQKGQNSITHFTVIQKFPNYSLVQCSLETGRTHQIRVHMKAIGHPLLGDTLYSNPSDLISRQALHSCLLNFVHPVTKENLSISCELPQDMQQLI